MSSSNKKKRKHKPSTTLNVHEFISALNGDDPLLILQKLHDFVTIVRYERTLALSSSDDDMQDGTCEDEEDVDGGDEENSSDDDDLLHYLFNNDDDQSSSTKRQKLNNNDSSKNQPSWTNDTNNYNVPFVGTSIFPTLPSSTNNLNTKNTTNDNEGSTFDNVKNKTWPTTTSGSGILATYNTLSPMGVELLNNDYTGFFYRGSLENQK